MPELNIARLNQRLEGESASHIVRWARETFDERVAATSSFQTQSLPLLYIISQTALDIPVFFLDTGFHFQQTLDFRDEVVERLGLDLRILTTRTGHEDFRRRYGELHQRNADLCCQINKVRPLKRALKGFDAWITGIRRDQTATRAEAPIVAAPEAVPFYDVYKISPVVTWTTENVWEYVEKHDLPVHPLTTEGYRSVGCAPCTQPVKGRPRAGRWSGRDKTECGLHISDQEK